MTNGMIKEQYTLGVIKSRRIQVENGIGVINTEQLQGRSFGTLRGEMLQETVTRGFVDVRLKDTSRVAHIGSGRPMDPSLPS